MTGRILRIELMRSTAPWVAVVIVVLGAVLHYLPNASRQGWWTLLAVSQRNMLALLVPLALGAGAWAARRERRSRMEELIATTPRPRWRRVLPTAVAMAVAAFAGYVSMFVVGAGAVIPYATYFSSGVLLIVAVGALAMITAAWIGMAVGGRWPSTLTPPLLGIGAAAVLLGIRLVPTDDEPAGTALYLPMLVGGAEAPTEFVLITARAHLAQAVWLLAVAAAGLVIFAMASLRGLVTGVLLAIAGAVLAMPLQPSTMGGAYTLDRNAIAPVCTSDTPTVCVSKAHEGILTELRGPARQALAILSAKLPNAPTSVAEAYPGQVGSDRQTVFLFPFPVSGDRILIDDDGRITDPSRDIPLLVLAGAFTGNCDGLGPATEAEINRYIVARLVATAWLLGTLPDDAGTSRSFEPADPSPQKAWDMLLSLPPEEQRARVAALREAELNCRAGDRLDILIGPSGSR